MVVIRNRARIFAKWSNIIGPRHVWPQSLSFLIYYDSINNSQRFALFWFLASNGYDPQYLPSDFKQAWPDLDAAAMRQLQWLKQEFRKDPNKYKAWNIYLKRTI